MKTTKVDMHGLFKSHAFKKILPFAGALTGYLVFHPYTMLASFILHLHQGGTVHAHWNNLFAAVLTSFEPRMIPMAMAFTLFGGLIGMLSGIILERKERLILSELENEKKRVALKTLQEIMVTLSHYLLNANVVIGGMVRSCLRMELNKESTASLKVIAGEARKIETVIRALKKVTEIKTTHYTKAGHELMLDIAQELEREINSLGEPGKEGSNG